MWSKQAFSTHCCPLTCELVCVKYDACVKLWVCVSILNEKEHFMAPVVKRAIVLAVIVLLSMVVFTVTCIPSNALINTFYITCHFMDILIATNYLCLGLLLFHFFSMCFFGGGFNCGHAFLAMALKYLCWRLHLHRQLKNHLILTRTRKTTITCFWSLSYARLNTSRAGCPNLAKSKLLACCWHPKASFYWLHEVCKSNVLTHVFAQRLNIWILLTFKESWSVSVASG